MFYFIEYNIDTFNPRKLSQCTTHNEYIFLAYHVYHNLDEVDHINCSAGLFTNMDQYQTQHGFIITSIIWYGMK